MDFNLTEISVINVVFVKEDSRLTIATTPTKGISIRRLDVLTKIGDKVNGVFLHPFVTLVLN